FKFEDVNPVFLLALSLPIVYFAVSPAKISEVSRVSFSYRRVMAVGVLGPMIGVYGSVLTALLLHFSLVNKTHCRTIINVLPRSQAHLLTLIFSISSAVGTALPERWIFRLGIILHATQRYLDIPIMSFSA